MDYRRRLSSLEKKAKQIRDEVGSTVPVACSVWLIDEHGDIIPDSGQVHRVPVDRAASIGVLLASAPIDKSEWPEVARKCDEYQYQLKADPDNLPEAAIDYLESYGSDS